MRMEYAQGRGHNDSNFFTNNLFPVWSHYMPCKGWYEITYPSPNCIIIIIIIILLSLLSSSLFCGWEFDRSHGAGTSSPSHWQQVEEEEPKPVGWMMCFLLMTFVPVQKLCVNIYTVETLYSTIYYSKYFIELNFDKSTQYVALWTHKRHPIPRPFGRAMECLLWVLQQKLTVL